MSLEIQIDLLKHRFLSGDLTAQETMLRLLKPYVTRLMRRASRQPATDSLLAWRLKRLLERSRAPLRYPAESLVVDEVCRTLCNDLLEFEIERPAERATLVPETPWTRLEIL